MSEEKEPYFDGPLVTPPSGQRPFYPGSSPQHNFGQLAGAAPAAGFPQQAAPVFYNPNDFVAGAASVNPWEVPVAQEPQAQHDLNGLPTGSGDINTSEPGTQACFGGVDTNSSASSSLQTSPEHLAQRKVNDIPYNPSPYEHQMYSAHANSLFTPQVEGPSPQSQIFNPLAPSNSDFPPPEQNIQNSTFLPGGTSGQHSYAHPPASTFFVPNSGPPNKLDVQNYMNPVPHDAPTQPSTFTSNVEGLSNPQQNLQIHENPSGENEAFKDERTSLINPMDLHNGAPAQTQAAIDQTYMNMAYNHDYSGIVPSQGSGIRSYIGSEFQVEAPSMMIPASSSQDYDILHSQGTWEEQSRASQVPAIEPAAVLPQMDEENGVHGAEAAYGIENEAVEDATQSVIRLATEDASHPVDGQNVPSQDAAELPSLDEAGKFPNIDQRNDASLYDPTMSDQVPVSDPQKNDSAHALDNNLTSNGEPSFIRHPDTQSQPAGDSTLSLDYNNGSTLNNLSDLQDDNRYAYGPVTLANEDNMRQQPYTDQLVELDATAMLQPDLAPQELLPHVSGVGSQNVSSLDIVNNGENLRPTETPESPVRADGLHPRQFLPDPNYSESPHHFASPNSAFESRIRSQSTGSSNSNDSSHRLTTNQPYRNVQNRVTLAPYPAASLELPLSSRQETVPTSNPFSTNTMHSSHMSDQSVTQPVTTVPAVYTAIPPIPDIVRPLPSGSGDENLRTSATVPFSSTNQSLHSQVLRNRTAYPPEPVLAPPQQSRGLTSSRPQPDLIQSPPEAATARLRTSTEVSHTVMALKTSEPPNSGREVSSVTASVGAVPVSSHSYLSQSLHNSHSDLMPPVSRSLEPISQSLPTEQSPESFLTPSSARTDDLHQRDVDINTYPVPRRGDEDSDRDHRRRDSQWDEHRRPDDEYRRRDYDYRYGQAGRWEQNDDRYRDGRYDESSRSRPESRQSGHPDSYYSGHYGERYDRDYRDRYYNDRYQAYDGRPHYRRDDRNGDRYYDSYHGRYQDPWSDRDRQYYDQYYYDSYYRDYRYHNQTRPEDEDSRSVFSERSRVAEPDTSTERDWHTRQGYRDHYEYSQGYDNRHYEESLTGESTLSNIHDDTWQRLPQVPARQTPAKFSSVHTVVRFGAGGHLIKVLPNRPTENQPSTVEIHSLEILLQNTPEAEELRSYPGPLSKDETHKNDVLQFVSTQSGESMKDIDLLDRRSTALIWDFLALLVRQNGSVLGTDIAELLTQDHSGDFTLMQSPLEVSRQRRLQQGTATPNSISDDQAGCSSPALEHSEAKSTASTQSTEIAFTLERNCNRFRELLLHGRRKDALEWAMKSGLWGHALLLASKTDGRTHAQVMLRFANSLPINDPLQTVYQIMSGRQPAAATCVSEDGWGDWRPHLAMILSNPTSSVSLDMRAVLTMGDTLSTRGLLHAAHFCYLMSSTPLGYYGRTTSKMVLLGGNHTLPFTEFATWDSIRRTEIYEYAISLGKPLKSAPAALPAFQLYKFIYACKLAEYGLISQAFHYCERIAKSVCHSPSLYSATFVNQLVNISDQLRHHDPQIQAGVSDAGNLRWLETLRNINVQIQSGAIVPRANVPPSVITTSNTPSVVSTTPTSDGQNDEIRFSAHTPDQDDSEDMVDSGRTDPRIPMHNYGQNVPQASLYSSGVVPQTRGSNSQTATTGEDQQRAQAYGTYGQEQKPIQMHDPNMPAMQVGYQQQQQQFMQPNTQAYTQPQIPRGDFSHLASQANPLAPGFTPSTWPPDVPYQQQNSYGFNSEQEPYAADEEAERADQYDYYDKMADAHNKVHRTRSGSPRSRTISQSSQRSRASTLKGYDRTTPTSMLNHADKGRRSRTASENSTGRRSRKTSGEERVEQQKQMDETTELGVKKSKSWSLFGWFGRRRSNQVHLPDDKEKEIVWDNEKKRWVNKNGTEEETAMPGPPPMDNILGNPAPQAQAQQTNMYQTENGGQPPGPNSGGEQLTANRFSLKNLGGNRSMYKNAFSSSTKPGAPAPAPADLLPGLHNATIPQPTGFMIPNPVPTSQPSNVQDHHPVAASAPVHAPNAAQSIQTAAVAPGTESDGPTMFFNPSQFTDLLSQPSAPARRGNALTRRGRAGYPGRR